jgi:CBS domain-containing protein
VISNHRTLHAEQVMTRTLISAAPGQDLNEVEAMLIENRIGGVPVVDQGRLVGVLSRSDVARVRVLMRSLDGLVSDQLDWPEQADGFVHAKRGEFSGFRQMIGNLKVADAMRDQLITCAPDTLVGDVAHMMVLQHVHRVIVVEDEKPLGIITSLDLVKLLAGGD